MPVVLGVDSSTQSTKVVACELDTGRELAHGAAPHPSSRSATNPAVSQQDPDVWWQALAAAIGQLGAVRDDVVAMSVAGQQHGLVLLDGVDRVIRKALLWNDTTAAGHAAELVDRLGASTWAAACGSVPVASFTVAKLAWVAEHEPDALARTRRMMLPHDFLTWRLTGNHVTDRGDASGTGWFASDTSTYQDDLLAVAVADPARIRAALPAVLGPWDPAGSLTDAAAEALGLPAGVDVAVGTGDNMAAALGLGLRPGDVALSLGTSGTVFAVSPTPTADASGVVAGFADATGAFLPLVCTLNATRVTDTVAGWLGTDPTGLASLALDAPIGFDGVVLVPYFDGERTPNLPEATGSFHGLRTTTSREALARAAHDGVLCALFAGLDALTAAGVALDGTIHLVGGGARSAAYRQRAADLAGIPVQVPDGSEAVALGAAAQAAVIHTDRSFPDLADAWSLGAGQSIEPADLEGGARVRAAYEEIAGANAAGPEPPRHP